MLTIDREKMVRVAILADREAGNKKIAREVGVSHWSVAYQRKMLIAVASFEEEKLTLVRDLLFCGLSAKAVSMQAAVPKHDVLFVRRYYFLQPRKAGAAHPTRCPTCDAMMFSDEEKAKHKIRKRIVKPNHLDLDDARRLYGIVLDICELDKLRIVTSPLFYYLAQRAKKVLQHAEDNEAKRTEIAEKHGGCTLGLAHSVPGQEGVPTGPSIYPGQFPG